MTLASRQDAGRRLGELLRSRGVSADLVLGLPRGGVPVAAKVAKALGCALDVLVVRKIGHPFFREFAVGALAEADVVVLDEAVLQRAHIPEAQLQAVIEEEGVRLRAYEQKFARANRPTRAGKAVVIVDDGLATGATLEAAVLAARKQEVRSIAVAVPVASTSGAARITRICSEFYALLVDPEFEAVGQYYRSFTQTTDEEVQQALAA